MEQGTVRRFNPDKNYGFIEPDGGGDDVHLHARAMCDPQEVVRLDRGVRVSYRVTRSDKGLRAQDVRLIRNGQVPVSAAQFRDEVAEVLAAAVAQIEAIACRYGLVP